MAISGTTPEPPAIRKSGPPRAAVQTKWPPIGPRSSNRSPARTSPTRYGETSPVLDALDGQGQRGASGADAIE